MTKKDFEAIAKVLSSEKEQADKYNPQNVGVLNIVANRIANVCEDDNARFDRDKFLTACGF